jgi:intracellular multiplication protein IcmD
LGTNYIKHLKVIGGAAALFGLLLVAGQVSAGTGEDLTKVVDRVQTNIGSLTPLLSLISYIAGIAFCIAGIVQFKAHKDNPTQVPLSKPLVYIGVGSALLFLPSIVSTAGQTIFGGGTSANTSTTYKLPE